MDRADVEHNAVEVGVKFFTEIDVIAVITTKRGFNISPFALAQQLMQDSLSRIFSSGAVRL